MINPPSRRGRGVIHAADRATIDAAVGRESASGRIDKTTAVEPVGGQLAGGIQHNFSAVKGSNPPDRQFCGEADVPTSQGPLRSVTLLVGPEISLAGVAGIRQIHDGSYKIASLENTRALW